MRRKSRYLFVLLFIWFGGVLYYFANFTRSERNAPVHMEETDLDIEENFNPNLSDSKHKDSLFNDNFDKDSYDDISDPNNKDNIYKKKADLLGKLWDNHRPTDHAEKLHFQPNNFIPNKKRGIPWRDFDEVGYIGATALRHG
uniref:Uncharacterized protein n=1 Tax=Ciona savignyi TaxID=51511 RepID=H2ZQU8_CIOSA